MNTDKHRSECPAWGFICVYLCSSVVPFFLIGCTGRPNQANIELRKQVQSLGAQLADLKRIHESDVATIRSMQTQGGTTRPALPQEQTEKLFTVHGISLGRLTGGADLDPAKPGDEGIKIYAVPTDETGDELKAAGSFVVEAYDLNEQNDNRVGRWEFSTEQARHLWQGQALLYTYVLTCPWQTGQPRHSQLTVKVTFRDELTLRTFTTQKIISVNRSEVSGSVPQ